MSSLTETHVESPGPAWVDEGIYGFLESDALSILKIWLIAAESTPGGPPATLSALTVGTRIICCVSSPSTTVVGVEGYVAVV